MSSENPCLEKAGRVFKKDLEIYDKSGQK